MNKIINKKNFLLALFSGALLLVTSSASLAASPDGAGPWADSVVTSSQGLRKDGTPVIAARSNASAALGVAEDNVVDSSFFSLGFGGTITLGFDNGISDGVLLFEATNPNYPNERASVEFSSDGTNWTLGGQVSQDGTVNVPLIAGCVNFVRITDISVSAQFQENEADGYDIDGVRAEGDTCTLPSASPTSSPNPSASPSSDNSSNNSSNSNNSSSNESRPTECTDSKPNAPSISVSRINATTARVTWGAVSGASHYTISYGTSPGNYQYGVSNTGNVTSYEVGGLGSGNYYFAVYAVNNCKPSDKSNEASTGGGSVLGASTSGGGQVLGASTDGLAAAGFWSQYAAVLGAVVALVLSTKLGHTLLKK